MNNHELDNFDIYTFDFVPFWQTTWFKIMFIMFGFIIIFILLLLFYKHWSRLRKMKVRPADEVAYNELAILKNIEIEDRQSMKKFYFSLSKILKNYLQQRYRWKLAHKTEEELVYEILQSDINEETKKNLVSIFEGAKIIKFSNQDGLQEQAKNDLQKAYSIIEQTKIKISKD